MPLEKDSAITPCPFSNQNGLYIETFNHIQDMTRTTTKLTTSGLTCSLPTTRYLIVNRLLQTELLAIEVLRTFVKCISPLYTADYF